MWGRGLYSLHYASNEAAVLRSTKVWQKKFELQALFKNSKYGNQMVPESVYDGLVSQL